MCNTRMLKAVLSDVCLFAEAGGIRLRAYQVEVARAVGASVLQRSGLTFVVMFPRQSGKNELQAQIEAYLLTLFSQTDCEIVKVSPTWKPQSLNAMRRLQRVLERNLFTRHLWRKESGYIYRLGRARIFFLSGAAESNIVGATASALLEVDEAQDVQIDKFDKEIAPMAASANATRVFWGTAWTSRTLLGRELRAARQSQREDGRRRAFVLDAGLVAAEVPAYGRFVAEQVQRLGRSHPLVRTQYFSEEIDAEGGMFLPARRALMRGSHPPLDAPVEGRLYALLIDVAGEDEGAAGGDEARLSNPARDATALTVVEIDLAALREEHMRAAAYRVVARQTWVGIRHTTLYSRLKALADHWQARRVVIDASGVGAGLASFLDKALPGRVLPFVFNAASKSKLGWDFLGLVDGGRFKDYACGEEMAGAPAARLQAEFYRQLEYCQYEILPGPEKRMRWGVPDGSRAVASGELLHDDLVISAALCAALDGQPWPASGPALVVAGRDPLKDLDKGF